MCAVGPWVSGAGELHPRALAEPDMTLSSYGSHCRAMPRPTASEQRAVERVEQNASATARLGENSAATGDGAQN